MQAVIMAAGTGSRLEHMTQEIPKALVEVAGKPLLAYTLAFARLTGCSRITVVTGYHADKVNRFLDSVGAPEIESVHNPDFRKGNLYSLGAALDDVGDDFILFNTDHVYGRRIADKVTEQCSGLVAFCDQDRKLGADDMKVLLSESGHVSKISKQLEKFDRGYVGMTFCSKERLSGYRMAFDRVASHHGDSAVVEMILADLAQSDSPPAVGDISGVGWLEIDTPGEHARAQAVVEKDPDLFAVL